MVRVFVWLSCRAFEPDGNVSRVVVVKYVEFPMQPKVERFRVNNAIRSIMLTVCDPL